MSIVTYSVEFKHEAQLLVSSVMLGRGTLTQTRKKDTHVTSHYMSWIG